MDLLLASGPTGDELLVLVASYSYWWQATRTGGEPVASDPTSGEWSYWWRVVLVANYSYWGRVVLLVVSGPTGGEWYWWRTTRTGGEWYGWRATHYWWRATRTGGELLVLVASYSYWWRVVLLVASGPTGGEWSY